METGAFMECRMLSEKEFETWDKLVDLAEGGTVFHKSFWFRSSQRPFSIFGCFRNGELVGGLPMINKKRLGVKKAGLPLFTPYADIINLNTAANKIKRNSFKRKVVQAVLSSLKQRYHIISIGISPDFGDLVPFINYRFALKIKVTYRLNLAEDISAIWNSLHGSRRTDIRNAEKAGFTVIEESRFDTLSGLISKTYERQAIDKRIENLASSYVDAAIARECGLCLITYDRHHNPIGGIFLAWDKHCAYYLLGGFDHEKGSNNAVTLALWKAICYAKEELNLQAFDFEGSIVPQLETFFRRFGGDLHYFFRARWEAKPLRILSNIRHIKAQK